MFNAKNNYLIYIYYALIGAILFPLLYYLSLQKKYKFCALIPTIPVLGLFGLFMISINNKSNIKDYIKNHIIFIITTIIFYLVVLSFYNIFSIYISLFIGLLVWLIINCYNLYF